LALTSLPEGVTSIGYRAFEGCTSLALASLPKGARIEPSAFNNCPKMSPAIFKSTTESSTDSKKTDEPTTESSTDPKKTDKYNSYEIGFVIILFVFFILLPASCGLL
jgi:hypothetical protein